MNDLEFIKKFSNIKISNICKKYNINQSNLISGKVKEDSIKKVKRDLLGEMMNLFNVGTEDNFLIELLFEEFKRLEEENNNLRGMLK